MDFVEDFVGIENVGDGSLSCVNMKAQFQSDFLATNFIYVAIKLPAVQCENCSPLTDTLTHRRTSEFSAVDRCSASL
jgi:hypothetical protein